MTVVICTRNRGATVVKAVRTILANDYPRFAIIVVDQSDDDCTRAALQRCLDSPQVSYLRMPTPGLAAGRNRGMQAAQSEYIALTDDDCEVPCHWLRTMADAFAVDARIGVVFGNVMPAPHDRTAGFVPAYERRAPFLARSMRDKHDAEGVAGCMGVRRSVWQALGSFDEMLGLGAPFQAGEESDFAIRTLLAGYWVYETPAVHLIHHGFYPWDAGRSVVYRNWFGTGAMIIKHLKCRHWCVTPLLGRMAWRWAFARSRSAVALGAQARTWLRLVAFLHGMLAGLRMPVQIHTGQYRRTP